MISAASSGKSIRIPKPRAAMLQKMTARMYKELPRELPSVSLLWDGAGTLAAISTTLQLRAGAIRSLGCT